MPAQYLKKETGKPIAVGEEASVELGGKGIRLLDQIGEAALHKIRMLFHRDMGAQGRMLVEMLRSGVYALCRNDETRLDVADLGRRHKG